MSEIHSIGDGNRTAGRDYYENVHVHGVAEKPIEGQEIAPCRKCQQPIWIYATVCPNCAYDPGVEARIIAVEQRAKQVELNRKLLAMQLRAWSIRALLTYFVTYPLFVWSYHRSGGGTFELVGAIIGFFFVTASTAELLIWYSYQIQDLIELWLRRRAKAR